MEKEKCATVILGGIERSSVTSEHLLDLSTVTIAEHHAELATAAVWAWSKVGATETLSVILGIHALCDFHKLAQVDDATALQDLGSNRQQPCMLKTPTQNTASTHHITCQLCGNQYSAAVAGVWATSTSRHPLAAAAAPLNLFVLEPLS